MERKIKIKRVVRLSPTERMLLRRGGAHKTKKEYKRIYKKINHDYSDE